jgi:MFS family permease
MNANATVTADPTSSASRQLALPGARVALVLLLIINLFNYIDRQVLASVVHPIEKQFFPQALTADGQEDTAAKEFVQTKLGSLQTAFMFSYMILAPLFGWLADRTSRWMLIGVGVLLWSFASGASGLATTFLMLLITRCFVGVGEAAYGPAAPTIIADLYPVARRGQVLAWFYAAIPVGSALGYTLGGLVLKLIGKWEWAFFLVVPPGVLLAVWCFFMKEPSRGQADQGARGQPDNASELRRLQGQPDPEGHVPSRHARLKDYLILARTPSYVLVTLGMTAMTFALGGIAFWMPRYIVRDLGATDEGAVNLTFGAIIAVAGLVATILGGIAGDKLRSGFPGSYFLVSGFSMLLGFPTILLFLWAPYPWYWVCIFLACFFLFFNTGPSNTILANVTHPSVRASAFALNIFIIHALGDAISPTIIGAIADASNGNMKVAFLVVSATILLGGLLWLWGARYLARDTDLAPTRLTSAP